MAVPRRPAAPAPGASVLVVDDSADTLELIQRILAQRGHRVTTATGARDALAILASSAVDLMITDIRMPGMSGSDLIREARARHPGLEMVVVTGYATIEGAVEALRDGAWDYLSKPFTEGELLQAVRRVLQRRAQGAGPRSGPLAEFHGLFGDARVTRTLFASLEDAAKRRGAVLLVGEPGSGRESAALALHAAAGRTGRFARVSLDARAAGAADPARALAESAAWCRAGTLYLAGLDDATDAAVESVAALLADAGARGGSAARIVASASTDVLRLAERGRAWAALPKRLGPPIAIPPLRERGEDVTHLAQHFLAELAAGAGTPARTLSPAAAQALRAYAWPGNVRELRSLALQLAGSGRTGPVSPAELPPPLTGPAAGQDAEPLTLSALERRHIEDVLARAGGNKTRAAELLGIDRKTLREKLRDSGEATDR